MIDRNEPTAIWGEKRRPRAARIKYLLRHSQQSIPIPHHVPGEGEARPIIWGELTGTLDEFEEFFYHNEFELAWDTLMIVGQRTLPAPTFWTLLAEAAMLIRKYERYDSYFMSLVRRAIITSSDLRRAIDSLPQQLEDADNRADAEQLIGLLTE